MDESRKISIRPLVPADQSLLWEMLYQSLFVPKGRAPFERQILNQPAIARYVKDWGRTNDSGFVAVDKEGRPVGAVWLRLMKGAEKGFGYVDDETPELGMAVLPEYRGKGTGTMLLSRLIESAQGLHPQISLSVGSENPALRLYKRMGFEIVGDDGASVTMKRRLNAEDKMQPNSAFNPTPR